MPNYNDMRQAHGASSPVQQGPGIPGVGSPTGAQDPVNMALSSVPVVGSVLGGLDPASPYQGLQKALNQASQQSQMNANLQWQRQMQGLSQALGYVNHSQNAFDKVYGHAPAAPGSTLPQGMPQMGPSSGPGLAGALGRR